MKKALSLIELIFTILIIGIVFSVIPRIIYISNKSLEVLKKEDAIFNIMSKAIDISLKAYDEKNIYDDDILLVNNPPVNILDCNESSWYRVGGFKGSRNCRNGIYESDIFISMNSDGEYDYIEGYNGVEVNTTKYGRTLYTLKISVGYTDEYNINDYDYNNGNLSFKFTNRSDNNKTNIKRVYIKVFDRNNNIISSVPYYSANIGHIQINGLRW